ncbi:hypothetical protein JHW43_003777 [Diplocarpon mali]|nr:hypothetical protein JHW43_003777 [Diplocarpon mali]
MTRLVPELGHLGASRMSSDIRSKNQAFYLPLSERPPGEAFSDLLPGYSKIPEEQFDQHVEAAGASRGRSSVSAVRPLHDEYLDLGHERVRDEGAIPRSHFVAAGILDQQDPGLDPPPRMAG